MRKNRPSGGKGLFLLGDVLLLGHGCDVGYVQGAGGLIHSATHHHLLVLVSLGLILIVDLIGHGVGLQNVFAACVNHSAVKRRSLGCRGGAILGGRSGLAHAGLLRARLLSAGLLSARLFRAGLSSLILLRKRGGKQSG